MMNPSEFRSFYNDCWKYCKPRLRNLTTNQADIDDVFAEAISRFWVNSQQGKIAHSDNHHALVYVMAKNMWLGNLRKEKHFIGVSIDANKGDGYEIQLSDNEQDYLTKMIQEKDDYQQEHNIQYSWDRLDEKCRNLLTATIIYKEKQDELLSKMNFKNTDTVKASKYRCLQYLKKFYYEKIETKTWKPEITQA
jgi:DNA-directed RNA polymerase specialized sigma24 family protein